MLLGRYPHVEPSRCTTRDEGEKQLGQILESGITTFVSLQVGGRQTVKRINTGASRWHDLTRSTRFKTC